MTPEQFVRLIDETFCGADAVYGPYHQLGGGDLRPPKTVIADCLYEFSLADNRNRAVSLQVFRGVNQLGGMMWQQVVRVLIRAATSGHPSLPVIQEGGFLEAAPGSPPDHGFAFVLTEHLDSILSDDPSVSFGLADRPMVALRQFHLIADGLAALHRMGVIHRNLWPGAITWVQDGDDSFQLGLSGFEMSTLIANMLGTGTLDAALALNTARHVYASDVRALPYMPPERMDMLYGDGPLAFVETEFSDVYSLGVLASEWFLGALPDWEPASPSRRQTEAFREKLRKELANSQLPIALRELLTAMIELDPDRRLSAGEVVATISSQFEAISAIWDPANQGTRPFLLLIKTHEAAARELVKWGWIKADPTAEDGADELAARIEEDLTSGRVLHAPHGADPYFGSGASNRKREAAHLIIGKRAAWFCRIYALPSPFGAARPMPQILEIRFVLILDSVRGRAVLGLENRSGTSRPTRVIEVIPATPAAPHRSEIEAMCEGRPSWQPVLDAVVSKTQHSAEEMIASQAFDWLLEYLGVELQAQQYPYVVVKDSRNGDTVTLRWDREADRERLNMHPMLAKYAADPRRRPDFGEFFGVTEAGENENNEVEAVEWRPPPGGWGDRVERCVALPSPQGPDQIQVRTSGSIPPRGVLRPAGQIGTRMLLDRQAEAKTELLDNHLLLGQLTRPSPIPGRPVDVSAHTADLIGDSARVIGDMLQSDPFFALQGPPGTGKTEIAARAVTLHLAHNLNHRVLISAQSNYALDNLAQRVLTTKGLLIDGVAIDDPNNIALRISTTSGERRNKVDPQIQGFTLAELVVRRQEAMIRHADKEVKKAATPVLRALLVDWKRVVERAGPELSDRLHRGANIVFATCATATPRLLNAPTSTAAFDWVIVEEAAKAWPTELAIPLVRGVRWTLIGDHHQLGAHREREAIEFLEECGEDEQPELRAYRDKVEGFSRYLMLFGGLFDERGPRAGRLRPTMAARLAGIMAGKPVGTAQPEAAREPAAAKIQPVQSLRDQFRMRDPIAQVISRVFYRIPSVADPRPGPNGEADLDEGLLITRREDTPHWGQRVPWLAGEALVWLDTGALPDCSDELSWENPGEAGVIERLLQRLGKPPSLGPDRPQLAIITPYRQQLVRQFDGRDATRGYGHTVHAFQGREAEIVVVSLVRDNARGDVERPWMSLGHLVSEPLVNVMLSRARGLLVIVGDFSHFARFGRDTKWSEVCAGVQRFGKVIPAGRVYES